MISVILAMKFDDKGTDRICLKRLDLTTLLLKISGINVPQ